MKKIVLFFLFFIFLNTSFVQASSAKVVINGKAVTFSKPILNINGHNYFPMRELLNKMGVTDNNIQWNSKDQSILITNGKDKILYSISHNNYVFDGLYTSTDNVYPVIKNGSTYLPIKGVAGALGFKIDYDSTSFTTTLTKLYPINTNSLSIYTTNEPNIYNRGTNESFFANNNNSYENGLMDVNNYNYDIQTTYSVKETDKSNLIYSDVSSSDNNLFGEGKSTSLDTNKTFKFVNGAYVVSIEQNGKNNTYYYDVRKPKYIYCDFSQTSGKKVKTPISLKDNEYIPDMFNKLKCFFRFNSNEIGQGSAKFDGTTQHVYFWFSPEQSNIKKEIESNYPLLAKKLGVSVENMSVYPAGITLDAYFDLNGNLTKSVTDESFTAVYDGQSVVYDFITTNVMTKSDNSLIVLPVDYEKYVEVPTVDSLNSFISVPLLPTHNNSYYNTLWFIAGMNGNAYFRGDPTNNFGILYQYMLNPASVAPAKNMLESYWSITDHDSALNTIDWLYSGGANAGVLKLMALPETELKSTVSENQYKTILEIKTKWPKQGVLAWDMCRVSQVALASYVSGYISRDELIKYSYDAAIAVQNNFTSWEDMDLNFTYGAALWLDSTMENPSPQLQFRIDAHANFTKYVPKYFVPWNTKIVSSQN